MSMENIVRKAVVAAAIACGASTAVAQADREQDLLMQGMRLPAAEAGKLQEQIKEQPDELDARLKLLGYYFMQRHGSADAKRQHGELVAWVIDHHADMAWAGLPYVSVDHHLEPEGFAAVRALWLKQLKLHSDSAQVHANAAAFFIFADPERAEGLLQQAQQLEPDAAEWSKRLGHLYALEINNLTGDARREQAKKALAEFERAMDQADDEDERYYSLKELADLAFEAGEDKKAESLATELLETAKTRQRDWNSGNAIHHGHLVLGRLAVRRGDVEKAKAELLAAGRTTGSPQLNSFGPNMMLAKELIEKGEREVVLEYFSLCRKFWNSAPDLQTLDDWTAMVQGGRMPDFGGNLAY
jgi:tetratricopeptide (TPR) repeat protein